LLVGIGAMAGAHQAFLKLTKLDRNVSGGQFTSLKHPVLVAETHLAKPQ
jgi:hypothetical protein